ncbi:MAG: RluA family pseudouridine synthase [Fuerstiella sp.]|nr:RluA family pseudouridine synthase [Fuerstiella sp.]
MTSEPSVDSPDEPDADQTGDYQKPNSDYTIGELINITVEARAHGWRLDHYLTRLFPNHSRAALQRAIQNEHVRVNGLAVRSSRRLRVNDRVEIQLPDGDESRIRPENIPIDVLYEDDSLIVVNKKPGMVVHPGRGTYSGTLTAALQFHFDTLSDSAGKHRPGIVHRLDRDTSGVILVARDNQVHQLISKQFEQRKVSKEYRAIVRGVPELACDTIRTHVCVHPRVREKMTVCMPGGRSREAVTVYRTAEEFGNWALMELHPQTGRTHQLRVHMLHIGTPIVADRLYIGEETFTMAELTGSDVPENCNPLISRQALHAFRLTIRHPVSGMEMQFEAPLPPDMQQTLDALRHHHQSGI